MRILQFRTIFLLGLAFLMMASSPAHAQKKHVSGQEKGLIAFYKLSGITPPFDKWIDAYAAHKSILTKDLKEDFKATEKLRLQWALGTFDIETDLLGIETTVMGSLIEKNGKTYIAARFPNELSLDDLYFPYNVEKSWVAVILKDIEKYMVMELSSEQLERARLMVSGQNEEGPLKLNILYRADSALDKPVMIDRTLQYVMMGEIAHWAISPPNKAEIEPLWEYYAPWYLDADKRDLLEILESP